MKPEEPIYNPREDLLAINRFERGMQSHHEQYTQRLGALTPETKAKLAKSDFFKVVERREPWGFEKWHQRFDPSKLQLSESELVQVKELVSSAAELNTQHRSYIHHVGKVKALMGIGDEKNKLFSQVWVEFRKIFDVLENAGVSPASRDKVYEQCIDTLAQDLREISNYIITPKQLDKGRIGTLRLCEAITHAADTEGLKGDALIERALQERQRLALTATKIGGWERFIKSVPEQGYESSGHESSPRSSRVSGGISGEIEHSRGNMMPWMIAGGVIAAVIGSVALVDSKNNRRPTWSERANTSSQNNRKTELNAL